MRPKFTSFADIGLNQQWLNNWLNCEWWKGEIQRGKLNPATCTTTTGKQRTLRYKSTVCVTIHSCNQNLDQNKSTRAGFNHRNCRTTMRPVCDWLFKIFLELTDQWNHRTSHEYYSLSNFSSKIIVSEGFLSDCAMDVGKTLRRRNYSLEEIRRHNTEADCWVIIDKKVYDVTKWLKHHPGGILPLVYSSGEDCSSVFKAFHPFAWIRKKHLPVFYIGDVEEPDSCVVEKTSISSELERIDKEIVLEGGYDTHCKFIK